MTEKSQDESAETLSDDDSVADTEASPALSADSPVDAASTHPERQDSPEDAEAEQAVETPVETEGPATQQHAQSDADSSADTDSAAGADSAADADSGSDSGSDATPSAIAEGPAPQEDAQDDPSGEADGSTSASPASSSSPDSPSAASPSASSPLPGEAPGSVRWSRPTPARPTPSAPESSETGLSSFFDDLDEKFMTVARRVGSAFRRPAPGEQTATEDAAAEEPAAAPDATEQAPVDSETPASEATNSAPPSEHSEPAQSTGADGSASAGSGPAASAVNHAPADPQEGTENADSAPLSLPRPRRALDEQRQRDVILEKAAAIEAATASNYRPTGREFVEFADDEEDLFTYIPPYNLPSRDPDPAPVRTDLYRQIFVSVGALAALVSLVWMFGAFSSSRAILGGSGLNELSGGWYSGNQALLSPDANFYWLWPVIVLGLIAHAVHQWTTTQISTPRQRRSGWQVGSASVLMLIWTAAVHHGMLTLAVLASLAAALALIDAIRQFTFRTARTSGERRFADTTTGLFAGWAMVAAMSSVSVWLTAMGWRIPGIPAVIWALLGLGICIWGAAYYAMTERGRIAVALGMGWGMFWLIFPRLLSDVTSVWVAISAAMGAFVVILATESRRHKINHAERRAAMGRPLEDII